MRAASNHGLVELFERPTYSEGTYSEGTYTDGTKAWLVSARA